MAKPEPDPEQPPLLPVTAEELRLTEADVRALIPTPEEWACFLAHGRWAPPRPPGRPRKDGPRYASGRLIRDQRKKPRPEP